MLTATILASGYRLTQFDLVVIGALLVDTVFGPASALLLAIALLARRGGYPRLLGVVAALNLAIGALLVLGTLEAPDLVTALAGVQVFVALAVLLVVADPDRRAAVFGRPAIAPAGPR